MSKVYNATWFYESIRTPDAVLTNDSSLRTYIQNNSITSCQIIDRSALPAGTTDVTSSLSSCLTNGYAGLDGTTLYITGLSAGNKVNADSNISYLFNECRSLISLNLNNFDTSNVIDMSYMFQRCTSLPSLNLNNFDISNVTNISYMFYSCPALTSLDVSNFDTSNVTNMRNMFSWCSGLTSLDVSNFDTSNVTNMGHMFSDCSALTNIYVSRSWYPTYTTAVTTSTEMFYKCKYLPNYSYVTVDYTKAKISTEGGCMTLKQ